MKLHIIDILIIVLYVFIVLFTGFVVARKRKKQSGTEDYLLAGRKLTLPVFVATLVATWYGSILGIGEFVYNSGIVAWLCFGVPYYIAAFLFAQFMAKKIRNSNVKTIPEQIQNAYGATAGRISSFIILTITIPAAYILMLGILIQMFSGWSIELSIIIGVVISLAYLFTGGFRADVLTNGVQFVFMYIGFGALLYFTVANYGNFSEMFALLPAKHLHYKGEYSIQYVFAWFVIAFQTFVDPSFHQRCSAAKTPEIARKGVFYSIVLWMIFDFFTLFAGLYAKAYLDLSNPLMAYPSLGDNVLPVVWKGIFVVAMISAVMSTLDSYAFISSATIGNDLLEPIKHKFRVLKGMNTESLTKIGLLITGIIGIIVAVLFPSVVQIIYYTSSIAVPGLIFPLILSMNNKYYLESKKAIAIMLTSSFASLIWLILSYAKISIFIEIEPMIAGISISLLLTILWVKRK